MGPTPKYLEIRTQILKEGRHRNNIVIYEPRKEASEETSTVYALISPLAPRIVGNFVLCKPPK